MRRSPVSTGNFFKSIYQWICEFCLITFNINIPIYSKLRVKAEVINVYDRWNDSFFRFSHRFNDSFLRFSHELFVLLSSSSFSNTRASLVARIQCFCGSGCRPCRLILQSSSLFIFWRPLKYFLYTWAYWRLRISCRPFVCLTLHHYCAALQRVVIA